MIKYCDKCASSFFPALFSVGCEDCKKLNEVVE
jgi:hypothetical protein